MAAAGRASLIFERPEAALADQIHDRKGRRVQKGFMVGQRAGPEPPHTDHHLRKSLSTGIPPKTRVPGREPKRSHAQRRARGQLPRRRNPTHHCTTTPHHTDRGGRAQQPPEFMFMTPVTRPPPFQQLSYEGRPTGAFRLKTDRRRGGSQSTRPGISSALGSRRATEAAARPRGSPRPRPERHATEAAPRPRAHTQARTHPT